MIAIICQYRSGGGKFTTPHDSTVGVGEGFYWFGGFFLLFILLGVVKAYWDDKDWRGSTYRFHGKKNPSRKK
jgi:hypothetical protein